MENKIFFNFSYLALKLLGSGLYSNPWNAISELVANGFDAGATDVYVYINRIDKEHSTVEIFDNGSGMSYDDLVQKYVFVGRNKRLEKDYKSVNDNKALGRKGIGKLATLYLSNDVHLISKTTESVSSWGLNINDLNEDDKPALEYIDSSSIKIDSSTLWDSFNHGLMLRLNNVNLTGLGEQTVNGLINRLSDFYILNSDKRRIWISFVQDIKDTIDFKRVTKNIAFKNFYVLFNNSEVIFKDYDLQRVKLKTDFPELQVGYPVIRLNNKDFELYGSKLFADTNGNMIEKDYKLTGWIGIHTSIDSVEAKKNDPLFLKNRATSPNRLRLYIREKLAIDNFLDYMKNTQAFSNYIEGEISFDILDDDDLPDIATANRQQLSDKDERVQLLISLLRPILGKLITLRVKLSSILKSDEDLIRKKKADEISVKHEKEIKELEEKNVVTSSELEVRKKQVELLAKGLRKNEVRMAESLHTITKNTVTIDRKIDTVFKIYGKDKSVPTKLMREISNIKLFNQKSLLMTKFAFKGKFELKSKIITSNIGSFIDQYLNVILQPQLKVAVDFDDNPDTLFSFDTTSLGIIIDNVISNSLKASAENIIVKVDTNKSFAILKFTDDGNGYDHSKFPNPEIFFDLGARESRNPGYGIGLYHIKELVRKNQGEVFIDSSVEKGFCIVIKLKTECESGES